MRRNTDSMQEIPMHLIFKQLEIKAGTTQMISSVPIEIVLNVKLIIILPRRRNQFRARKIPDEVISQRKYNTAT